jgi:hypothetical protein
MKQINGTKYFSGNSSLAQSGNRDRTTETERKYLYRRVERQGTRNSEGHKKRKERERYE